jgi:hydrogenase nickel incorporation protein HypB
MFSIVDVVLINKIDTLACFEFDFEEFEKRVKNLNPNIVIIPISAKTGEGIDKWADWLRQEVNNWNQS